ncbi:MAG: thioredoxin domain-containing protein, partial [Candidatus Omnitrophica bacterium]|nr:thioredoxin domain-containing protein [Candidatus Omnitrophota bacterium]
MQKYFVLTFFFLSILSANLKAEESGSSLAWQKWEDGLFEKAKSENRFVILDLEAVWCHWCHVMEETTYQDPKVKELIQAKYIPVRVDQDANPDISHRYEDYGWPATVVFAPDGSEIVKRRGYIPPGPMASLLQAIIDDPAPGPSITQGEEIRPAENAFLAPDQAEEIQAEHLDLYDKEFGGWGSIFKLIDADHMEYAMLKAAAGDKEEEGFALKTFDQALNLLDPVWGGFYQYSDQRDWKSPHFEKIMIIQTDYMRLYAMAWLIWQKPEYLNAAKAVADYAKNFMTSEKGAFYTSQDADVSPEFLGTEFYALTDSARRESGKMPRIDQHIYSRENGWMISSLAALYAATGEPSYLNQAVAA